MVQTNISILIKDSICMLCSKGDYQVPTTAFVMYLRLLIVNSVKRFKESCSVKMSSLTFIYYLYMLMYMSTGGVVHARS